MRRILAHNIQGNEIESMFKTGDMHVLHLNQPKVAYSFINNQKQDLLTGAYGRDSWIEFLDKFSNLGSLLEDSDYHVFHLSYEAGLKLAGLSPKKSLIPDMIYLKYSQSKIKPQLRTEKIGKICKMVRQKMISKKDYEDSFQQCMDFLYAGDSYQINLTRQFEYKVKIREKHLKQSMFNYQRGQAAYCHASFLGKALPTIFSNSPECLFEIKKLDNNLIIKTMPIKGTLDLSKFSTSEEAWKFLKADSKNRAELSMITDLMANDLSKIDLPVAAVKVKGRPLKVLGLIHQYSVIESLLRSHITLKEVINAVFPGGSITGAPKRRTMEIINKVEPTARGMYCGTTILAGRGRIVASINIRTALIDLEKNIMGIGAGGGVTVGSQCDDEWQEMLAKENSFTRYMADLSI